MSYHVISHGMISHGTMMMATFHPQQHVAVDISVRILAQRKAEQTLCGSHAYGARC